MPKKWKTTPYSLFLLPSFLYMPGKGQCSLQVKAAIMSERHEPKLNSLCGLPRFVYIPMTDFMENYSTVSEMGQVDRYEFPVMLSAETQTSQKHARKQQCATAQAAGCEGPDRVLGRFMSHFCRISGGQTDTGVNFSPGT